MSEDKAEISHNFNPSLPPNLNKSDSQGSDKKPGFLSKFIKEDNSLEAKDVQEKTQELFDLLVHRVELRIDISRQSEKQGESGSKTVPEMSLQERLDLIKSGKLGIAVNQVVGEDTKARTLETDLKELRETEEKISELTKHTEVVNEYSRFREKRVEKLQKAKEATDGLKAIKKLQLQQEKMARVIFLGNRQYSPGERRVIDENRQVVQAIKDRVSKLKEDPEVFDLVRLRQLQEYQQGLKKDKFAETPTREKYIDFVRGYWAQGKKVLLTGPTGGGKTELLLHASRSLFGAEAERLTGHELMTNYEVYGKTKGGVQDGQIALMFGAAPFIRSIERNVPFVFDEINVVPNKILMRLKTDLNARVGTIITIQEDSDKEVKVGDKFALGATANVKSEKHTEREKLDPALVRMFESMTIDYFPPNELYDIMLSSMMDVRGGVKLSVRDATTTLKALSDATEWVQEAYLGQVINTGSGKILEARGQGSVGKSATLREAVLDPGKSLDMLVGWEDAERAGLTFEEFLNGRIVDFVENENFPEEDRYYLAEIFALQGFLRGVKVTDLRIPSLDQATLDAWSGYDGKRHISKNNYTPPEIVAKLDPYSTLKRPVSVEASDLLDEGEIVQDVVEAEVDVDKVVTPVKKTTISGRTLPNPNVPPAPGNLSSEERRAFEFLDLKYPPGYLSTTEDFKRYNAYPLQLNTIAVKFPNTIPEVVKRYAKILDKDASSQGLTMYLNNLNFFASKFAQDASVKINILKIVKQIEQMERWKVWVNPEGEKRVKEVFESLNDIESFLK